LFWSEKCQKSPVFWYILALTKRNQAKFEFFGLESKAVLVSTHKISFQTLEKSD